jgi:hypothetical protein
MRINRDFPSAQQVVVDRDRVLADWWVLLEATDEDIGSGRAVETMRNERERA